MDIIRLAPRRPSEPAANDNGDFDPTTPRQGDSPIGEERRNE